MMKYRKRAAGIILCAAMAGNLLTGCSTSQKTETAAESVGSEAAQTQQASEKAPEKPSGSIPNIRLVSWQTPSDPKTKPVYDAVAEFAEAHKSEFVERFPELSLFFKAYSLLDSEMICIFPYLCPYAESAREIREIFS